MFANWEHDSSYLDSFIFWTVFANSIDEETSNTIFVPLIPAVGIRAL